MDAGQQPLARGPGAGEAVRAHVLDHLVVDALGRAAQRQLAQGGEVAVAEIVVERPAGGLGHVDLALVQPLAQLVRREVDQLDLGLVEHAVGHGLAHPDMGDLRHHVVQALDMLDVDGGPDVDAGRQQLLDVHPALGVAAARCVVVGELVDQRQLRAALQQPVEIHLLELAAAMWHAAARHDLEPGQQRRGLAPAMGLDQAHHHVDAIELAASRRGQHLVGLADPGCRAEEDLELPTPLLPRLGEQGLGRGALVGAVAGFLGHHVSPVAAPALSGISRLTTEIMRGRAQQWPPAANRWRPAQESTRPVHRSQ